jgi:hypothetical protein
LREVSEFMVSNSVGLSMGGIRSLAHLVSPIVVPWTMCVCQTTPPPDLALACNNRYCPLAAATRNSHDLAAARYPYSRIAQDAFRSAARHGTAIDSQLQAPNGVLTGPVVIVASVARAT